MEKEKKELAIIILNWNGKKVLEEFLPSVAAHSISDRTDLFVADNGSEDDSIAYVETTFPEVKIIKFAKNYGFAEGYNRAVAKTRYRYTLLLNSDVAVKAGWWQPLLDFMESHPDAGAVQPKIKSYKTPERFEYAGAAGGLIDRLGFPYCRGRVFDKTSVDRGQYDGEAVKIAWASGACLLVDTELYLKIGGLDPRFFAHMEEIDLCWRIISAGRSVYFVPDSEVFHLGGASLNYGNPTKTYLNFRNNLLLLHKNMPAKRGKRKLLARRLVDTLAFLMYALKGDVRNAGAVLRAHSDFKKMRKLYKDLPEKDIMKELPGSGRSILISDFFQGLFKKEPSI